MFQWGHDFSAMDSLDAAHDALPDIPEFQWGHDFSAMDRGSGKGNHIHRRER